MLYSLLEFEQKPENSSLPSGFVGLHERILSTCLTVSGYSYPNLSKSMLVMPILEPELASCGARSP